jgi:hypothetical protein
VDHNAFQTPKLLTGTLRVSVAVRKARLGNGAASIKAVLFAMASAANKDDFTLYASAKTVGEWSGLSERSAVPTLAKLRAMKLISLIGVKVVPSGQSVNLYRIEVERIEALGLCRVRDEGASPLATGTPEDTSGLASQGPEGASGPGMKLLPNRGEGASVKHTSEHTKEHPTPPGRASGTDGPIALPEDLLTPELLRVWENWQSHLREKNRALRPTQALQQLEDVRRLPVDERVRVLEQAIGAGWTRLFPLPPTAARPVRKPAFKGAQT